MGKYLNPGKVAFEQAARSDVFVDKTRMIRFLNSVVGTQQKYVSVSRPRRFGKTMAISMICAYYSFGTDSRELFCQRELARTAPVSIAGEEVSWDAYLGSFDVVRVVMTDFFKRDAKPKEAIARLQRLVCRDIQMQYPNVDYFDSGDLIQTMEDAYYRTGRRFVVVVDEWDAIFRVRKQDRAVTCMLSSQPSGLHARLAEGPGVPGACLHNGHPANKEVRRALGAQHV